MDRSLATEIRGKPQLVSEAPHGAVPFSVKIRATPFSGLPLQVGAAMGGRVRDVAVDTVRHQIERGRAELRRLQPVLQFPDSGGVPGLLPRVGDVLQCFALATRELFEHTPGPSSMRRNLGVASANLLTDYAFDSHAIDSAHIMTIHFIFRGA